MVIWWFSGDLKGYFIGFVMVVNGIFHGDLNQGVVHGTSWWFHQWRTRDIMGFHGNWMDNMGIQLTKCQCFPACTIFFRPIVPQHSTTFLIFPVISQMLIGYLQGETSRAIGPQTLHPGWAGAASLLHRLRLAGEEGAPGWKKHDGLHMVNNAYLCEKLIVKIDVKEETEFESSQKPYNICGSLHIYIIIYILLLYIYRSLSLSLSVFLSFVAYV